MTNMRYVYNMVVECVGVLLENGGGGGGGVLSERRRASPSLLLSPSEPGEFSFSLVPLEDYSKDFSPNSGFVSESLVSLGK